LTDLLLILLGSAGIWGIGLALAQFLLPESPSASQSKSNLAELLGLGLVMGFGSTALFYLLWAMTGLRFTSGLAYTWLSLGLVLGVGTLFVRYRDSKRRGAALESASDQGGDGLPRHGAGGGGAGLVAEGPAHRHPVAPGQP